MYEVIISQFEGADVRVVDVDGVPWFIVKDVLEMLGIKSVGYVTTALRPLDDSEKAHLLYSEVKSEVTALRIPNRGLSMISESGLYKLVMRSNKSDAKPFQDWVTKAVLPAIRKDGGYIAGEEKVATGEMSEDEFIFKAMTMMQGKIERLSKERDSGGRSDRDR